MVSVAVPDDVVQVLEAINDDTIERTHSTWLDEDDSKGNASAMEKWFFQSFACGLTAKLKTDRRV